MCVCEVVCNDVVNLLYPATPLNVGGAELQLSQQVISYPVPCILHYDQGSAAHLAH